MSKSGGDKGNVANARGFDAWRSPTSHRPVIRQQFQGRKSLFTSPDRFMMRRYDEAEKALFKQNSLLPSNFSARLPSASGASSKDSESVLSETKSDWAVGQSINATLEDDLNCAGRSRQYRSAVISETFLYGHKSPKNEKITKNPSRHVVAEANVDEDTQVPVHLQQNSAIVMQSPTLGTNNLAIPRWLETPPSLRRKLNSNGTPNTVTNSEGSPGGGAIRKSRSGASPLSLKSTLSGRKFNSYEASKLDFQTPGLSSTTRLGERSPFGVGSRLFGSFQSPHRTSSVSTAGHFSANVEKFFHSIRKVPLSIPTIPYKVLDAPDLQDDFYLNLLDWSSKDILAVGLGSSVYLWDAQSGKVEQLIDFGTNDTVTCLNWHANGQTLAVGSGRGKIVTLDAEAMKVVREWPSAAGLAPTATSEEVGASSGHVSRVGSMAWNTGVQSTQHSVLASGGRDRHLIYRDVRSPGILGRVGPTVGHRQEICGLKWSADGKYLASGGNDNRLFVWNGPSQVKEPLYCMDEHKAAVKALAWHPSKHHILASGGGTADRHIRLWDIRNGHMDYSVDTGSQVCNVLFSKHSYHLVSTHGYSQNQIMVWKYMHSVNQLNSNSLFQLTGHTQRVLYLAMSPDGENIVTGSGDETLRFWKVFARKAPVQTSTSIISENHPSMQIR